MTERLDPTKWECSHCAKTSYESEDRGWQAIGKILRVSWAENTTRPVPVRVYSCPYGEGFHLTSKDEWVE